MTRSFPIGGPLVLSLILALLPVAPASRADEAASAGTVSAEGKAGEMLKTALPPEIASLFPIGREFKGLSIPTYSSDDQIKAVMRADLVIRVDEQFIDFLNLTVHVYNSRGEPETTITMPEAAYDILIGELASKTASRIEQPRFTVTGDKMIFETRSQISRLVGNVKLVIPDVGELAPDMGAISGKRDAKTSK